MTTFRFRIVVGLVTPLLWACGSPKSGIMVDCDSAPQLTGPAASAESVAAQSAQIVWSARHLRSKISGSEFAVGFWADMFSGLAGTEAYSTDLEIKILRSRVADVRAYELALANNRQNVLPAYSKEACKMLADSVASFGVGNSKSYVLESLSAVERHFTRLFYASGGKDLDSALLEYNYE